MSKQEPRQSDLSTAAQLPFSIEQIPVYGGYRPLDSCRREIRLLRINAGTFKLHHVSLDDDPTYHALSYCWGPATEFRNINLGGEEVVVREIVYSFLEAMMRKYESTLVWLDMLCINQRDIDERNSQVKMMGEIFQKAIDVHAWLGNSNLASDAAMNLIEEFAAYNQEVAQLPEHADGFEISSRFESVRFPLDRSFRIFREEEIFTHVSNVSDLLRRMFWTRIWIVQELVLAQSVTLVCGDHFFPFQDFCNLIQKFEPTFDIVFKDRYDDPYQGCFTVLKISEHRSRMSHIELEEILGSYASRLECSNPRDKLCGFRALSEELLHLPVDYGKNLTAVFKDVLDLDVLNRAAGLRRAGNLLRAMQVSVDDLVADLEFYPDTTFSLKLHTCYKITRAVQNSYCNGLLWHQFTILYSSDPSQHLLQRHSRRWMPCYAAYGQFKAIQAGDWLASPDHPEAEGSQSGAFVFRKICHGEIEILLSRILILEEFKEDFNPQHSGDLHVEVDERETASMELKLTPKMLGELLWPYTR
jgi:hypothetical protein